MAGYFSKEALETLHQGLAELPAQLTSLREAYILREYKSEKAAEYAKHGFCRRLAMLVQAIDRTFELLPPELDEIPSRTTVMDATLAIQAFVMNCFGCLDNLAWVWVFEKSVKGKGGCDLERTDVGLGKKYVRSSFSDKFRAYLDRRKEWLSNLIDFRDSLAHRIPLYIPPYIISKADAERHEQLDREALEAMRKGDHVEYDRLRGEQKKLGRFCPLMTHSVYEGSPSIVFHPQLLQDYVTVDEYGWTLLEEMNK